MVKNQAWLGLSIFVFGIWAAWMIGRWIAAGDMVSIEYAFLGAAVCVIAFLIIKDWRTGFYVFIVWLLFEDLIRKYMGNNMVIYFAKDALVAITYLSFFISLRSRRAPFYRFPFLMLLGLFFWLGVLQCFNVNSPGLLYSLLGFKLYFFYIPLMFVGYALIRTDEDLRLFLAVSTALAGVIAGLGIFQSILGPSFLNPKVLAPDIRELGTLYRYAPVSGQFLYQPNSIFVSSGRFGEYLLLAWILGFGTAAFLLLRRLRGRTIIFSSMALIAVALVMGGGRGVLVYSIASALVLSFGFLWGAPWRQRQTHKLVKTIWRTTVVAGLALLIVGSLFPEEIGARLSYYAETVLPTSPEEQLTTRVKSYPIQEFEKAFEQGGWIFGHGIGTASLGVQYVSRWLGQRRPNFGVESGYGNIVLEYGIAGLVLWLVWTAAALIYAWKVVQKLRQTAYFPLALSIFWFSFLLLYPMILAGLNAYQDYVYNAYFWLLIGILYRLPVLASEQLGEKRLQVTSIHEC